MTWSYTRNGLAIAHHLQRLENGEWGLEIVDFDGFVRTECYTDESAGLRRQMDLERALILHGWGLDTFKRAA